MIKRTGILVATIVCMIFATSCRQQSNHKQTEETKFVGNTNDAASKQNKSIDIDMPEESKEIDNAKRIRIMSYNVENLFDTVDDVKNSGDNEFTPEGEMHWDKSRYEYKLKNVAKVIELAGQGEMPAIVGLCEVENKTVLHDLIHCTRLNDDKYRYIHKDSPDHRGIDVAMIYRTDMVEPIKQEWLKVDLGGKESTREIMHVVFKFKDGGQIHMFENHWPSMAGGAEESEWKRDIAANVARNKIESIFEEEPDANIVLMGDFNCEPDSKALTQKLKVYNDTKNIVGNHLYNLLYRYHNNPDIGTHKYNKHWNVLDQVIVSGNLLNAGKGKVFTEKDCAYIYHDKSIIFHDKQGHASPRRTFRGKHFSRGFSDHLPVVLDVYTPQN